jgi:hypothetical protein
MIEIFGEFPADHKGSLRKSSCHATVMFMLEGVIPETVFPSLTDTFGLVMIEAMACGTPVAAFNVASPIDVVESGVTCELDPDLSVAVASALKLDRDGVRRSAAKFTWERVAEMFEPWLVPVDAAAGNVMSANDPTRRKLRTSL